MPLGIIGPLFVNGDYAKGEFYVPMATTEGALVASYDRGSRLISEAGGARAICLSDSICRVPGFILDSLLEAAKFVAWLNANFEALKDVASTTTRCGRLQEMHATIDGNRVYVHFEFTTKDAAGQNMVTFATEAVCEHVIRRAPFKIHRYFIEANMSGDKKPTQLSQQMGRGKTVSAEVVLPRRLVSRFLYTTPEHFVEYADMATFGSIHSGAIGTQGHFANALAAIFIACGQDVACVGEAATGTSRAQVTPEGDLYVTVTMPNLVIGTVGGGTHLPTQTECLRMMDCAGEGKARKFAEIITAAVLAGEISIVGAIAGGYFTKAHQLYGRKAGTKRKRTHVQDDRTSKEYQFI
jgi:hydroxymethylglutaryl-CoA reductase (NADPH)